MGGAGRSTKVKVHWDGHRLGPRKDIRLLCFSGCLQPGNELQKQSRDQTQAIKPADWSVWSRDRFCKLQAT